MKRFYILTDLEGVSGTDQFQQSRVDKGPSMHQLVRETNACVAGILDEYPDACIDVLDGHGSGGLFPEDLVGCNPLPRGTLCRDFSGYDGLLFVGQHAMAGTVAAPLNHTFNSRTVLYYRLNDVFVGEFGLRALQAGLVGVPTIFLAGDDKAALEAQMFVPEIETVVTKYGLAIEAARHRDPTLVCGLIREGSARAVRRAAQIPPCLFTKAPFRFEARHLSALPDDILTLRPGAQIVDSRTYSIETDDLCRLPI